MILHVNAQRFGRFCFLHVCQRFGRVCFLHVCHCFGKFCFLHVCQRFGRFCFLRVCQRFGRFCFLHGCQRFGRFCSLHVCQRFSRCNQQQQQALEIGSYVHGEEYNVIAGAGYNIRESFGNYGNDNYSNVQYPRATLEYPSLSGEDFPPISTSPASTRDVEEAGSIAMREEIEIAPVTHACWGAQASSSATPLLNARVRWTRRCPSRFRSGFRRKNCLGPSRRPTI